MPLSKKEKQIIEEKKRKVKTALFNEELHKLYSQKECYTILDENEFENLDLNELISQMSFFITSEIKMNLLVTKNDGEISQESLNELAGNPFKTVEIFTRQFEFVNKIGKESKLLGAFDLYSDSLFSVLIVLLTRTDLQVKSNKISRDEATMIYNSAFQVVSKILDITSYPEEKKSVLKVIKTVLYRKYKGSIKEPTQKSTKEPTKGSGCFIATATYENYNHPAVIEYINFRESVLSNYSLGNAFINCYYKISPFVSRLISKNSGLKILTKFFLDNLLKLVRKYS